MSEIFTSTAALALKDTLEDIDTDEHGSEGSKAVFPKWLNVKSMSDNYIEYYEVAGSGLAGEKPEGESIPLQSKVTMTSGDYDQAKYSDIQMNPTLPDSAFELNVPADVKRVNVK